MSHLRNKQQNTDRLQKWRRVLRKRRLSSWWLALPYFWFHLQSIIYIICGTLTLGFLEFLRLLICHRWVQHAILSEQLIYVTRRFLLLSFTASACGDWKPDVHQCHSSQERWIFNRGTIRPEWRVSEWASEWVREWTSEWVSQSVSEGSSEWGSECS